MHFTATFRAHPPPLVAGVQHFSLDDDEPLAAGSRPDRLSAVSGPQERVLRHTVEQMADSTPVVPMLDAPVQQLGCSVVGSALGRWEPLPPHARVRPVLEQAAGHRRDQARLVEARHRTAMQVMAWFAAPVRAATLTWAERRSIASLMPRYRVPEAGAGEIVAAVVLAVDVPVIMQLEYQQSKLENLEGAPDPSSSTECLTFQLRHREGYAQCKTVQKTVKIPRVQFLGWLSTRPSLCNDRCFGMDSAEKLWRFRSCSRCSSWNGC